MTTLALGRVSPAVRERWRPVIAWWAISRLVTLLAFLVLDGLGRWGDHLPASLYRRPFALLGAWDGVWYARIAQHGYLLIPGTQSNPAFFPLYPILLRGLRASVGLPYTAGGALLANGSLLVALIAFYELGCRVVADRDLARRATCFMAITPMGFVFSMSYPESLTLALTVLALLSALAGRWLTSAALAATAVLASPEAVVLVIPLAAIVSSRRGELDPSALGRALAAVLAAPAAIATYPLYLKWSLHDASAWSQAEERWGRSFDLAGPWHALAGLPRDVGVTPVLIRDATFLLVYVALLVVAARRGIPAPWIAAGALLLAVPLFSGSFESEGRFGLLALPIYWGAGLLARSQRAELAFTIGSLVLLVAGVLTLPRLWP